MGPSFPNFTIITSYGQVLYSDVIFFSGMPILSPLLIFLPVFFFLLGFLFAFPGKI